MIYLLVPLAFTFAIVVSLWIGAPETQDPRQKELQNAHD